MSKTFKTGKGPGVLTIMLLAGGVAGSAAGEALSVYIPMLKNFTSIGFSNTSFNLHFLNLTLGMTMSLGPLTGLGLFLGFLAYRRL